MPVFEVERIGKLGRLWPNGRTFQLGGCLFKPDSKPQEFRIQVDVSAKDVDEAWTIGNGLCKDAMDVFTFCMNEHVEFRDGLQRVRPKGANYTSVANLASVVIKVSVDAPPTDEQLESLERAERKLKHEVSTPRLERLTRAIYWQAEAKKNGLRDLDRFINYWIALEVLVEGEGRKVVPKAKDRLSVLYSGVDPQIIATVVGKIYSVGREIVHEGNRSPQDLPAKLQQLKDIVTDLLREELGLTRKNLSRSHFN